MRNREPELCAPDPVRARIDTVIEKDGTRDVLTGVPTNNATLANLFGAAPPREGWKIEAYILVPAGATTTTDNTRMTNWWTPELDAEVARIEAEIRGEHGS